MEAYGEKSRRMDGFIVSKRRKRALITGITGQDGSYLAELLLKKGYEVHGVTRRSSSFNRGRIDHLLYLNDYTSESEGNLSLHYADLTDSTSIEKIIKTVQPDEVYNLAAQSHVKTSFDIPENTSDIVALGTLRILEALKNAFPSARFYQASSSEMFGRSTPPQSEMTPMLPQSPYAISKLYGFHMTQMYRNAYGLHASNGVLFNHESERRGESFVTRKITISLARIKLGLQGELHLGNLDAKRDWGHAQDYMEVIWRMVQQEQPDDYVIGTGEMRSVREFLDAAIEELGLELRSNGKKGVEERYVDADGKPVVFVNPKYFRPVEVHALCADWTKARTQLNWEPKIRFPELVKRMCAKDLSDAEKEALVKREGKNTLDSDVVISYEN